MRAAITSLALLTVLVISSRAQNLKPFHLYLNLGRQFALSHPEYGLSVSFEPAYRINDIVSVGLRLHVGPLYRTIEGKVEGVAFLSGQIFSSVSSSLYGKYYFTRTSFRPYIGFGVGIFSLYNSLIYRNDPPDQIIDGSGGRASVSYNKKADIIFGFYPRIGFDWWRINVNIDVNLIAETHADFVVGRWLNLPISTAGGGLGSPAGRTSREWYLKDKGTVKNNHAAVTLGFFLFGGKRG